MLKIKINEIFSCKIKILILRLSNLLSSNISTSINFFKRGILRERIKIVTLSRDKWRNIRVWSRLASVIWRIWFSQNSNWGDNSFKYGFVFDCSCSIVIYKYSRNGIADFWRINIISNGNWTIKDNCTVFIQWRFFNSVKQDKLYSV